MADAIGRLDEAAREAGVDWGMWSDRGKQTPSLRYEVRVFGRHDVRFIENGTSMYEAAAKAADRLESGQAPGA